MTTKHWEKFLSALHNNEFESTSPENYQRKEVLLDVILKEEVGSNESFLKKKQVVLFTTRRGWCRGTGKGQQSMLAFIDRITLVKLDGSGPLRLYSRPK